MGRCLRCRLDGWGSVPSEGGRGEGRAGGYAFCVPAAPFRDLWRLSGDVEACGGVMRAGWIDGVIFE